MKIPVILLTLALSLQNANANYIATLKRNSEKTSKTCIAFTFVNNCGMPDHHWNYLHNIITTKEYSDVYKTSPTARRVYYSYDSSRGAKTIILKFQYYGTDTGDIRMNEARDVFKKSWGFATVTGEPVNGGDGTIVLTTSSKRRILGASKKLKYNFLLDHMPLKNETQIMKDLEIMSEVLENDDDDDEDNAKSYPKDKKRIAKRLLEYDTSCNVRPYTTQQLKQCLVNYGLQNTVSDHNCPYYYRPA